MAATLSLFGPGDNCGSAARKILSFSEGLEQGGMFSFNEIDTEFNTFCSTRGCRERFMNVLTACADVSIMHPIIKDAIKFLNY